MGKIRLAGIGIVILLCAFALYRCNKDPKPASNLDLDKGDQAKVSVDGNKITVIKRNPDGSTKVETKYVPDKATVTYRQNGEVDIDVRQFGWKAEPGIGAIASAEGMALSLDVRTLYWKRMGLNFGLGIRFGVETKSLDLIVRNSLRPFVGVSYRLPFERVSNTSILVGYQPVQSLVCIGARVKF